MKPAYTTNYPFYGKLGCDRTCPVCALLIPKDTNAFVDRETQAAYHYQCRLSPTWVEPGSNFAVRAEVAKEYEAKRREEDKFAAFDKRLARLATDNVTLCNRIVSLEAEVKALRGSTI